MVLDLFAGTGALGLEALSRGAAQAVFVDSDRQVAELISANISACRFTERARVIQRDLSKGVAFLEAVAPAAGFDLIFLDPPYGKGLAQAVLAALAASARPLLAPTATMVVEERSTGQCPEEAGPWHCVDQRRYGEVGFWFYRHREDDGHE